MVLNGFRGSQHEHKAEGFQPLSALLALRAGAGSQANADLASPADLAGHRWPSGRWPGSGCFPWRR